MLIDTLVMDINDNIPVTPDTETRILKAAEHEFLTKGFAGARTTTIAEAAGVTHAMFHYYFRTKEKLFERIFAEKFELVKEALLVPIEDLELSLEEVIRRIIDRHMTLLEENIGLPQFIMTQLSSSTSLNKELLSTIAEKAREVIQTLQQKIDLAAEGGGYRRVDARMLLLDIVSLNVFPFMATPLVSNILGLSSYEKEAFVQIRKEENFRTIMRKIKI